MCFSASASFTASVLLGFLGFATLQKKTNNSNKRLFATVPILFSLQQAIEGVLWLTFQYPQLNALKTSCTYVFLFFALSWWPFWIPYSLTSMEHDQQRKKIMKGFSYLGIALAFSLLSALFYYGAQATIEDHHIAYSMPIGSRAQILSTILYLAVTIIPTFISTYAKMWVFGALIGISYAISYYFYYTALGSIWCFFAALISGLIYFLL